MSAPDPTPVDGFDKARHIKFWKRCATLLPDHYISADASRMSLGFFIVTALDLLGVLETEILESERKGWIDWIYSCQVVSEATISDKCDVDGVTTGGFRGFSGTHLGQSRTKENHHWDPANLPNTYFALATLTILGDDLERVQKKECLNWLGIAYILHSISGADRDDSADGNRHQIFDEHRMIHFIANCQSYDGGFGQAPLLEAHSGLNYCAIAALSFLAKSQHPPMKLDEYLHTIPIDMSACLKWMCGRQTRFIDTPDSDDEDSEDEDGDRRCNGSSQEAIDQHPVAGFNGREGKMADTCYCFWTGAALDIVDKSSMMESVGLQKYLINHTQHLVGGFGKAPGMPPDLLHSSLGLAALSITGYPGVKPIDSTMCISRNAAARLCPK